MTKHFFGGAWTQEKLDIVDHYTSFYVTALKNKNFVLHYADAFAGTGKQDIDTSDSQDSFLPIEEMKGSVERVLDIGGFDKYYFNDINPQHYDALKQLIEDKNLKGNAFAWNLDANEFVERFCNHLGPNDRAVLFVDPYKHEFKWESLELVASTGRIDIWILIPFGEVLRLAPNCKSSLTESGSRILSSLLGTDDWQDSFYNPAPSENIDDLFGEVELEEKSDQRVKKEAVESYITMRLESIFKVVLGPHPLNNAKNSQLFSLYCCISSNSKVAQNLAKKVGSSIFSRAKLKG